MLRRSSPGDKVRIMVRFFSVFFAILLCFLTGCDEGQKVASPQPQLGQMALKPFGQEARTGHIQIFLSDMLGWGEIANLTLVLGDAINLTVVVKDAKGQPSAGQSLRISSSQGNQVKKPQIKTNKSGRAKFTLFADKMGQDTLRIEGAGALATLALVVSDKPPDGASHPFKAVPKTLTLEDRSDVLSWKALAQVKVKEEEGLFIPTFSPAVKALHGQRVKLQGFMLPLENAEKQRHFILSSTPPTCFFCVPGGPESMVEIYTDKSLAFTFDPISLEGPLEVLEEDEMGLFYRMKPAAIISLSSATPRKQ